MQERPNEARATDGRSPPPPSSTTTTRKAVTSAPTFAGGSVFQPHTSSSTADAGQTEASSSREPAPALTKEERMAKMAELRKRMVRRSSCIHAVAAEQS